MTIRLGGILFGLAMAGVLVLFSLVPGLLRFELPKETAQHILLKEHIKPAGGFSFDGPLGKWDMAQLQRGYQVYKTVCAGCHSLKFVAFRDLQQLGYTEAEVAAEAKTFQVPEKDPAANEFVMREGTSTDYFPPVYYAGQGVPPDLSLITKARHDGTNYVYSLMLGYNEPKPEALKEVKEMTGEEWETPTGSYFNEYFHNINIAMPPPLVEGTVTYSDGKKATKEQMAQDVAAFLTWTAEPSLVQRKQTGWFVIGFLMFATALAFMSYKQIWAGKKPKKSR
jgi:ubiquinol-cytochrome c reductase cytochrome c1 subunit